MNPYTPIKTRRAHPDDIQEICHLVSQLGYPDTTENILARLTAVLKNPVQEILVAETESNRVVGYVHLLLLIFLELGPIVEIGGLVVNQECRRMGIGKALLTGAEGWAKTVGCKQIRLHSNVVRNEAHKFYQAMGYSITKTSYSFLKNLE